MIANQPAILIIARGVIVAKYSSKCPYCYVWIRPGDKIMWSEGYGKYIHEWCEPPMSDYDDEVLEDHGDR